MNLNIENVKGSIVITDTDSGEVEKYSRVAKYNTNTLEVVFSDSDSYSGSIDMRRISSPSITNLTELESWLDSLVLVENIRSVPDVIPVPIITTTTTTHTISSGFWYAKVEATNGVADASTVIIRGVTYDDKFVGVDFDRIESGGSISVVANGNSLTIVEVR